MLYAAFTFWLFVAVFAARGVLQLWSGMIRPRVLDIVLLPGTCVAQLGHVLGLLVSGASLSGAGLQTDGASSGPRAPRPRIPVIGPIMIGLLPLLACGATIVLTAMYLGRPTLFAMRDHSLERALPTSLRLFWQMLRDQIALAEALTSALGGARWSAWRVWLFTYLLVTLTVRMAPLPGTLRGALGGIVVLGACGAAFGAFVPAVTECISRCWCVLSLAVSVLTLLLLFSLAARGVVGLIRLLASNS